jgi:hypothetical protein
MKIIDYSQQINTTSTPKNNLLEIVTATLIFIIPVITLFLLAK